MNWILPVLLVACFVWAVVASVAASEWRDRAVTAEDLAADLLADRVSS